jgi:hypothetical protein
MIFSIIIFIIFFALFYLINNYLRINENFCYGNVYCNGNKDSALCLEQSCKSCGLQSKCTKDSECIPNNCIDGCCDNR